jgi:predicted ThiF/HesA family dinucleotide-utilizing enzyme
MPCIKEIVSLPIIIICDSISGQKYYAKVSRKEMEVQEFMHKDNTIMERDTCVIIQVIIGATRKVTKGLTKNSESVPDKHSVDAVHNTDMLGTSHGMWKILQSES